MEFSRYVTWSPRQDRLRAIVKTLLYRTLMIVITIAVAFIVTENATDAINIGIVANVVKTVTYYLYERLWDRITWGINAA